MAAGPSAGTTSPKKIPVLFRGKGSATPKSSNSTAIFVQFSRKYKIPIKISLSLPLGSAYA
jgi:hypothetical protein